MISSSCHKKKEAAKNMDEQISNLFSTDWKKLENTELLSLKNPTFSKSSSSVELLFYGWNNQLPSGIITHTILSVDTKTCFWSLDSQSFKISHFDRNWKCNFIMSSCHSIKEMSSAGPTCGGLW